MSTCLPVGESEHLLSQIPCMGTYLAIKAGSDSDSDSDVGINVFEMMLKIAQQFSQ